MSITLNNNLANSYFEYFKNLDTALKKQLIIKLTQSIAEPSKQSKDFSACFGAWDDSRDAQEIFDDIRNDRVNINDIDQLENVHIENWIN